MDGEKIKGKYIVERIESFIDKDDNGSDLFFVVTNLYPHGDLNQFLRKNKHILCTEQIIQWCSQLLIGAHTLNCQSIFVSDIRPSNIKVGDDGDTLKLNDFGTLPKKRKDLQPLDQRLFTKVEELDGTIDFTGKTNVYKIACIIIYLFIMLDQYKDKEESSPVTIKHKDIDNENQEFQITVKDLSYQRQHEDEDKQNEGDDKDEERVYEHSFFKFLKQGLH